MRGTEFRATLLGSGASVALLAAGPALAGDDTDQQRIEALRAQLNALQARAAALEGEQATTAQQQYVAAPANAVVGGDKPGSFRLPGSNTSVNIGGYAKLDLIYDFGEDVGDSFGFTGILLSRPGDDGPEDHLTNNFRLHAKQSRIWIKTWTPTDWGEFATHIEGDFEGGQGNQLVSNSDHFRLRHAYGQLGNVLAGQTWSNFNTPWQWPGTIDFNGTIGTSFIRQAQIRYTAPLGNGLSLAVSIENPEADGCGTTDTQPTDSITCSDPALFAESLGSTATTDPMPDIVARLQWGADWGTLAVAGVLRYFEVHQCSSEPCDGDGDFTSETDSAFGWGVKVAGVVKLWGKDSAGAEFIYGDGIGRYALWAVGTAFAASQMTSTPLQDPEIFTTSTWGGNVWIEHWWTDNLYSVAAFGYAEMDWDDELDPNFFSPSAEEGPFLDNVMSAHLNLQWQPVSRANIGIEGIYGHRETVDGLDGDAVQIQVGFQWGFST